jgi:hypothetical protein
MAAVKKAIPTILATFDLAIIVNMLTEFYSVSSPFTDGDALVSGYREGTKVPFRKCLHAKLIDQSALVLRLCGQLNTRLA